MAPRKPQKKSPPIAPEEQPFPSPKKRGRKSVEATLQDMFAQDFEMDQLRVLCGETSELGTQSEPDFVKGTGWTPLEFLVATYRNPFQNMQHRIAAAKSVLDYTHRKLPAAIEVSTPEGGAISLAMSELATALSDKELDTLEALLQKAQAKKK